MRGQASALALAGWMLAACTVGPGTGAGGNARALPDKVVDSGGPDSGGGWYDTYEFADTYWHAPRDSGHPAYDDGWTSDYYYDYDYDYEDVPEDSGDTDRATDTSGGAPDTGEDPPDTDPPVDAEPTPSTDPPAAEPVEKTGGCDQTGGGRPWLGLVALGLLRRRRR